MHDWAQSDRLSLAINFYDHGMDFFKPRTHNLHSIDGITGVEFPMQSYLAALLGKIFGREYISLSFRLITVIIACTGLSFLFKTVYRETSDFIVSLLPPLFIFCSPVFVFYTCNYLPDAAGTSIAFIGFYFVFGYFRQECTRKLLWAMFFFTLATLVKTSVGVCLVGFASVVFLQRLIRYGEYRMAQHIAFMASAVLSFGLIAGYYFYNKYLNETYGSSLFLATINPFKDLYAFLHYCYERFNDVWKYEYFLMPEYIVLGLLCIVVIGVAIRRKDLQAHLLLLVLLCLGTGALLALFGGQLWDHDYYIISLVQPTVGYFLLLSTISLYRYMSGRKGIQALKAGVVVCVLLFFILAVRQLNARLSPKFKSWTHETHWAGQGKAVLDQLHISKDEKISVLNEDAPNTALVYLDRRGYHIPSSHWNNSVSMIKDIMKGQNTHILIGTRASGDYIMQSDPAAFSWYFVPVAMDENIAVFRRK